ncbi:hypothetical protein VFPPC_17065 [Pochonia chlamydosporia 170]|uniref:Uncharacterized protein n=1 Tax=Pochonia chlamydosporia 170 TaxID=1380566 RepID=A0A179EXK7_METCM|nr:hypothetical protein VFPPC_17065 [Pochonia chlamydosporia 170]OAQ57927.1 hypothetical protein VFPPC_17065 [Pochonia chlamydosporia 170]
MFPRHPMARRSVEPWRFGIIKALIRSFDHATSCNKGISSPPILTLPALPAAAGGPSLMAPLNATVTGPTLAHRQLECLTRNCTDMGASAATLTLKTPFKMTFLTMDSSTHCWLLEPEHEQVRNASTTRSRPTPVAPSRIVPQRI